MTKPTIYPEWASDLVVDPISGQDNRVEPPVALKTDGWPRVGFPPRQYANWQFYQINNWVEYLDGASELSSAFKANAAAIPDMTVVLNAGTVQNGTTVAAVAAQTTAAFVAPVTDPRIDRIVIDEVTGVYSVVAGAEAVSPTAPAVPTGKIAIAQVALATATTEITNSLITDERSLFFVPAIFKGDAVDVSGEVKGASVTVDAGVTNRWVNFETNGVQRAGFGLNDDAETGSNAGSNIVLPLYADDGTTLTLVAVTINRATGLVTIPNLAPSSAGTAISGQATGGIGTYATLKKTTAGIVNPGDIVSPGAGDLVYSASGGGIGPTPSGTWRCMGYISGAGQFCSWLRVT